MEVLKSISYVKAKPLTDAKALLMEEIKEAVEEMKLSQMANKEKPVTPKIFLMSYNVQSITVFEKQVKRLIKNMLLPVRTFGTG